EWVVQYRVTNPKDFLFNVADPVKNIRDLTQTTMRKVVGDRSINDILTTGRGEIQTAVQNDMQKVIDETYKMGIAIEEVILQDVAPPETVQPSFNQVNSALQEQKQEINKAFEDQNRIIPEAKGKATREISQARGYREAVINQAEGDASRFEQVLVEYSKAPEVTRRRLYLELVEDMLGKVSNFTVVDPEIRGLLPVFGGAGDSARLATGSRDARASIAPTQIAEDSAPAQR
ncbi:MAG: FtsH protease activity modulator HflK, partial [Bdellovibrionales bacterium]|nr:FtsH protease activity modulator HflK [Bdellovibrionales bacterium]